VSHPPIVRAEIADLPSILALQKLAFLREAQRAKDLSIPPMVQTLEGLTEEFHRRENYKYAVGPTIIGTVRAHLEADGTCYIGRLCVNPEWQRRGIGTALMRFVERRFDGCRYFEIFTGRASQDVSALYQHLGYEVISAGPNTDPGLVFLRKRPRPKSDS
jgi:ribosomal protein S18 acetylase RimI-like enzyme